MLTMAVNRQSTSLATNAVRRVSVEAKQTVRRASPMDRQAREILADGDDGEKSVEYFKAKDGISVRDMNERLGHMLTDKTSADPAHGYIKRDAMDFKGSEVTLDRPKTGQIEIAA